MNPAPAPVDDGDVPAFWQRLGLPGLADVHTHFMPERLLQRVWEYFDRAGPLVGVSWPVRYRWPLEERLAHLEKLGVRVFTALAYAHRPDMAADLSRWTLDFAARTPGCVPSATFYPEPSAPAYVAGALAAGARVFKLHPQVGGFGVDDPRLDPVWGLLSEAGTAVVIHAGHAPVGTEHTGPEPLARVLARHPRLAAVVAHMGSPNYGEFLDLAERYERLALDTTMAFTGIFQQIAPFPPEELPRLHALGLAGKILLGTDYPNIPYPYAQQLAALAEIDPDEDWLRAVCWTNVTRVLGGSPSPDRPG